MSRSLQEQVGNLCHYCNEAVGTTKDHIIPKSWSGRGKRNLVPACSDCNSRKGHQPPKCQCRRCRDAVYRWLRNVLPGILETCPPAQRRMWLRRQSQVLNNYSKRVA